MNYEPLRYRNDTFVNETENYKQKVIKTEADLHKKTKEQIKSIDEDLAIYYKPQYVSYNADLLI